jgi:catechol 2,3-dioxygenase-like lactoylglutathione lyase family enzyme
MALKRMDNVGIVVEDLGGAIDFFRELGLELEGRATIEGEWAGRVTGLGDQRVEIAMMRTPDGPAGSSSPASSSRLSSQITGTPR